MVAARLTDVAGVGIGVNAVPRTVLAGWLSMKYSAAVTFWLPLATSLAVACRATVTVPLVELGVSAHVADRRARSCQD